MPILGFDRLLASFPRPDDRLGYSGTWREGAVKKGLLPVYSDWVTGYALTQDGAPVASEIDTWDRPLPVANARQRHIVLAQAGRLYPELSALRPERHAEDPDCPSCRGAGGLKDYPELICECGNLGWIPRGSRLD